MKKQTKTESTSPLRVPKTNRFDLKVKPIAMPHDDLIKPEVHHLELVEPKGEKNQTGTTDTTEAIAKKIQKHSVSPERDFTKIPNSLTRVILAQGLFKGKSKQIYDYLWSVSRGGINPKRTFRKTHREIMKGAGIGSRTTILDGLRHLENIGLITILSSVGVAVGNEYEIFTPDELGYTSYTGITGITGIYQKVVIPVIPLSGITGITQTIENKDTYSDPKTSFKDNEYIDDEPAARRAIETMLETEAKRITGNGLSKSDAKGLRDLAELLRMELEIATARTNSVSSVPSFLTEHLRRRLFSKTISEKRKVKAGKSTDTNKPENAVEEYQAEPLSKVGREAVLKTMREFIGKGQKQFVMSQRDSYTKNDWEWLIKQLEKQQ
jgi:hypothetical protein